MQLGITLPTYRKYAEPRLIRETALKAEAYGYHSVWAIDHIVLPEDYAMGAVGGRGGFGSVVYEPFATLGFVAGLTARLMVGTSISPIAYRHPLLQAKMVATLDQLSGGRAIYAGAAGYLEGEFTALGIEFHKRGAIADEYLQALRIAWTADRPAFHGRFVDFAGVRVDPKPLQKPHPPIWVGGDSDAAYRRVVRYGDGWHGQLTSDATMAGLERRIARLHEIAREEGREPRTIRISLKQSLRITGRDDPAETRFFIGTVEKVAADLERCAALGVETVVSQSTVDRGSEDIESVDVIGTKLIPRLERGR